MKVGLIGTGLMGISMVMRAIDSGLNVNVFNRTKSKLEPLSGTGAIICDSPADVCKNSDVIILMLTDAQAIREVILPESNANMLRGKTFVQMATIAPAESKEIQSKIVAAGGDYFEAPVLGSIPQVKSGTLIIMVGGTEAQFQQWQGLLNVFSPDPILVGEVGQAAATKLAMNQLIGSLTAAFSASLGLVMKSDVDTEIFMKIVRNSALYAPTYDKKLDKMLQRDFVGANFSTKHLLKDMRLFEQEAAALGLNIAGVQGVTKIVEDCCNTGLADADYSSLFSAVNPE